MTRIVVSDTKVINLADTGDSEKERAT